LDCLRIYSRRRKLSCKTKLAAAAAAKYKILGRECKLLIYKKIRIGDKDRVISNLSCNLSRPVSLILMVLKTS